MGYNYSQQEVNKRVGSGKDAERRAGADKLYAQATQPPHEDDAAAKQQLIKLAGVAGDGSGFATMDAKNYTRSLLQGMPDVAGQYDLGYGKHHDGGGFVGSMGGVLKKLAPASMLIPGVGMAGAGLIAAGANSAGSMMKGEGLDLGGSFKDALLAGAGNKLMGNGLGKGDSGMFGSKYVAPDMGDVGGMGDQGHTPTGTPYHPGDGAKFNASVHAQMPQSVLSKLGAGASKFFSNRDNVELAGKGLAGGFGVYDKMQQRGAQTKMNDANLAYQKNLLDMAEARQKQIAGVSQGALARLGSAGRGSIFGGGSSIF